MKTSVGTVHTFQGGEAQTVVLLLGGNPARERGIAWAAEKPNLLNVAATRAKARFYIVGDKAIWTRLGPDTFGLIANKPEFPTILAEPAFVRQADKERIERISSLDGHLQVLADAFAQAQRRIVITSPYVTLDAVGFEGLNLPALVQSAGARGVRVGIYVDPTQNRKPDEYRQALQSLTDARAVVRETPGFHSKSWWSTRRRSSKGRSTGSLPSAGPAWLSSGTNPRSATADQRRRPLPKRRSRS
nr:AAA domain-containing protein [Azospirillum argentinense]